MDMNRLQQQAAIARVARQQQNTHKAKLPTHPHGVASSYDADTGMDIIRLSDGSLQYALPDTSGVRSPGDQLIVRTGGGTTHIDTQAAIRQIAKPDKRKLLKIDHQYPFKVLFSVMEDGIQKFYIGGDRKIPTLIFEFDPAANQDTLEEAWLTNTGPELDDWIAGFKILKIEISG